MLTIKIKNYYLFKKNKNDTFACTTENQLREFLYSDYERNENIINVMQ